MKITISGYIHALASTLLLAYSLAAGNLLLLGLSLGMILVLYYSYESVKRMKGSIGGISISREIDRNVYSELEEAVVRINIENSSSMNYPRLYVYEGLPRFTRPIGGPASFTVALKPGARLSIEYKAKIMAPGKHVFRKLYLAYSDIFTYFHETSSYDLFSSLTALPLSVPSSIAARSLNKLIGVYALGRSASGLYDLASIREYQPGDDVRKILWKKYARTLKLYTRVDYGEARPRILYMIDIRRELWRIGRAPNTLAHIQLRAARAVLEYLVEAGARIDAAICVGDVPKVMAEVTGDPTEALYDLLSIMEPGEGCRQPLWIYRKIPGYLGRSPEEYDLAILVSNPYTISAAGPRAVEELLKTYADRLMIISPMFDYAEIMGGEEAVKKALSEIGGLLEGEGRGLIILEEEMKYAGTV